MSFKHPHFLFSLFIFIIIASKLNKNHLPLAAELSCFAFRSCPITPSNNLVSDGSFFPFAKMLASCVSVIGTAVSEQRDH